MLRHHLSPIVFVINNSGYTTERVIRAPAEEYHSIPAWEYHRIPELLGRGGWGVRVHTEGALEVALATAERERERLSLIEVMTHPMDAPETLKRFGRAAAELNGYGGNLAARAARPEGLRPTNPIEPAECVELVATLPGRSRPQKPFSNR